MNKEYILEEKYGNYKHEYIQFDKKLDGVGPVDNRPSTDKLHHFVRKKKMKKKMTCDM